MAVREVLRMGAPALLRRAEQVTEFNTPALDTLIEDMLETMAACDGVGLAAPQIGIDLRVVIFRVELYARYPDCESVPDRGLINLRGMSSRDVMDEGWEVCLSVPFMPGLAPRFTHIHYKCFDPQGRQID